MEEKMKQYFYHIEDRQFSTDIEHERLLGKEGDMIRLDTGRHLEGLDTVYILFINGNYVECIGDVEREFPRDQEEHERLKEEMNASYGF